MEYLLKFIASNPGFAVIGAFTLIQIAPIKINPWSWLVGLIHKFLFGKIEEKLSSIETKIDRVEDTIEEREAVLARTHILRFNDELHNGIHHSNEYHLQTLDDIAKYEQYCETHPDFANGRTTMATENIKNTYKQLYEAHKI